LPLRPSPFPLPAPIGGGVADRAQFWQSRTLFLVERGKLMNKNWSFLNVDL
jgi:hypothetical protein